MSGAPGPGAPGTVPVLLEDDSPAAEGIVSTAGSSHVTGSDSAPRRDNVAFGRVVFGHASEEEKDVICR